VLPTFLVVGAMKAGTTSLHRYLRQHPSVFVTHHKEPNFFSFEWERGVAWYEAHFAEAGDSVARGESSTSYTRFPNQPLVPERIASVVPDVRLIYLVRDPFARMRSHYLHWLSFGGERRSADVALVEDRRYLDWSRYGLQIDRYLEQFAPSSLLVLTAEDLAARRDETLGRVLRFIGLDSGWRPPTPLALNRSEDRRIVRPSMRRLRRGQLEKRAGRGVEGFWPRVVERVTTRPIDDSMFDLSDDVRQRLTDELRPDVVRLREFLGPDFDGWGLAGEGQRLA
jgi:hypothetical protein